MTDIEERLEVGRVEAKLAQREAGRGRGRIAERVEMRLDVTDGAVVIDQAVDLRLLEAVNERRRRRGRAGQHGQLAAKAKREALKKSPPRRVDGVGILQPAAVVLLDQVGVGAGG